MNKRKWKLSRVNFSQRKYKAKYVTWKVDDLHGLKCTQSAKKKKKWQLFRIFPDTLPQGQSNPINLLPFIEYMIVFIFRFPTHTHGKRTTAKKKISTLSRYFFVMKAIFINFSCTFKDSKWLIPNFQIKSSDAIYLFFVNSLYSTSHRLD